MIRFKNLDQPALPVLVILEFQSKPDEAKIRSTLVSVAHLNDEARHGPQSDGFYEVFAGMIHLTGEPTTTQIRIELTSKGGRKLAGTHHQVLNWNVSQDDASKALNEIENDFENSWGLLYWIACMRNAHTTKNRDRWLKLVRRVESKRDQGDIGRINEVFAEIAGTLPQWNETLTELNMEESQVVRQWTEQAVEKGQIQMRQADLLRLAKKKFKGKLKDEDAQMIKTQDDLNVLRDWLDALVEKDTYADFCKVLRE